MATPEADTDHGTVAALAAELAALRATAGRRHLLDVAAGVLVAQLGVEPAEAAEQLDRLAAETGQTSTDLAADLLNQATGAVPERAEPATLAEARRHRLAGSAVEAVADDMDVLADTLLSEHLRPLGAEGVLLWRLRGSGCLELVGHAGVSPLEAARWRWIPPQWPNLLQLAVGDGMPRWLPAGPPPEEPLPGPAAEAARAVLPLRRHGGSVGLALVVWPAPTGLEEPVRESVVGLLEVAGRVLEAQAAAAPEPATRPALNTLLDLLAHPAMLLAEDPRTGEQWVEHLNAAAARATALPDPVGRPLAQLLPFVQDELCRLIGTAHATGTPQRRPRLPAVHHSGEPGSLVNVRTLPLAPGCTIVLWHAGSRDHAFSLLELAGRLTDLAAFEDDLTRETSHWSARAYPIFGRAAQAGPLPLQQLAPLLHPDDRGQLATQIEAMTQRQENVNTTLRIVREDDGSLRHVRIIAEPVLTHGTVTGVTGVFQDVSAQHRTELALTATFDRLATVQEQAALRHRLALQLQEAIIPEAPDLRRIDGIEVAARYRPAATEYRVGGDWYEVLPLPEGRILVTVGDVAGHGIDAVNGMVALSGSLRGLAFAELQPAKLMGVLNRVTLHSAGRPTATAICALYDPESRALCWASAGHLPPLLLRDGRARLLDSPHDILLGALPEAEYHEISTELRPGDALLLYTDGLIERRHSSLDETLATLRRAAERLPAAADVEEQAAQLLAAVSGDTDDDASLVLLRIG